MSAILFFIFIFLMMKNPKDKRNSDIVKFLIIGSVVLSVLAILLDSPLGILAIIGIIVYLVKQKQKKDAQQQQAQENGWDARAWDAKQGNARTYEKYQETKRQQKSQQDQAKYGQASGGQNPYSNVGLTTNVKKRRKIVEDFNEKYGLCLTDEQISSIVNSSYMSEIWKREISDMNRRYDVVHEWFSGPTAWLRVYMHAFHIQDITSDIKQQEDIVMYAFESIFKYVDTLGPMTQSQRLQAVNNKFFTDFDEPSFMIAYHFLKNKGLEHKLEGPEIMRNDDSVDDLLRKYETQTQTGE